MRLTNGQLSGLRLLLASYSHNGDINIRPEKTSDAARDIHLSSK